MKTDIVYRNPPIVNVTNPMLDAYARKTRSIPSQPNQYIGEHRICIMIFEQKKERKKDTRFYATKTKTGKPKTKNVRRSGKMNKRKKSERTRTRTRTRRGRSIQPPTPSLNLLLRQRCDPKAPFNHTLHGLERVLGARINQTKEILDDASRRAMTLEVDQRFAGPGADLGWLLRVVGEVVDVEACHY